MASIRILAMLLAVSPCFAWPSQARAGAGGPPPERGAGPAYGTFGFDLSGMDTSSKPGDDFIRYCNGTYLAHLDIPADTSRYGMQPRLRALSEARTRLLIEKTLTRTALAGSEERKIADCYSTYLDEASIEARGLAPLQPQLDAIAAIADRGQLAAALGRALRMGMAHLPLGIWVRLDKMHPDRVSLYLSQAELGLPHRDYYLDLKNARFADIRKAYLEHIAAMLQLAGLDRAGARARGILDLETRMAEGQWSDEASQQVEQNYNPVPWDDLASRYPGIAWKALLGAAGIPRQERVIVRTPGAILGLGKLLAGEPLATWKDCLTFHALEAAAPYLPKAFVNEHFAFNGRIMNGQREQKPRWKRGVEFTRNSLADAVGKLYVAGYFPSEAREEVQGMARNLLQAMDLRLAACAWMDPRTRARARTKLARVSIQIGCPDHWQSYDRLAIVPGDALGNAQRAAEFEFQQGLDRLAGRNSGQGGWRWMTPMMVGGFSDPVSLAIMFPAGSFQPPLFDPKADLAVNYGGIGSIIGHEICHLLDDQGRKFDEQGRLLDWWTPEDVRRFKVLTDRLVQQVSAYEPLPGVHVNGAKGLGENLADLCGVNVAFDAYRAALGGKSAPVLDGFSGDQRFFMSYAQAWRDKSRDPALLKALTDGYTPGFLRPNLVRNLDAWYQAFAVKPGDALYLPPGQRIRIW